MTMARTLRSSRMTMTRSLSFAVVLGSSFGEGVGWGGLSDARPKRGPGGSREAPTPGL